MSVLGLAEGRSTTLTFSCGQEFKFTATFNGRDGQNVRLSTSNGEGYQLHRTAKLDGRRFANRTGNVILILRDSESANLTRGDVMVTGCSGTVPAWLLKTTNTASP